MWWLMFQAIPVAAWCIAAATGILPLKLPRRTALLILLALAAALGKFAFFAGVGGNGFNPDLSQGVILAYSWAYATAMLFAAFSTVAALAEFIVRLVSRHRASLRAKRVRTAALAVLAAATASWGMYEGVRVPDVKRIELSWYELPASFDGYRVVHLSDLHCSPAARRPRFEKIVERVNALNPDLIAITGDFVDGTVGERENDLAPLANLRAKDGVWGCTGNHEAYWNWYHWADKFREWDVRMLSELVAFSVGKVIRRGGGTIVLGGLHDPAFYLDNTWRSASLAFSTAGGDIPSDAFRILLYHRPKTEEIKSAEADVRLQLSGHTHGGAMPLVSQLVARFNEGRIRGVYEFAPGRYIHVSPGTGQWAGFPMRLFNPAEITEITLRRKARQEEP